MIPLALFLATNTVNAGVINKTTSEYNFEEIDTKINNRFSDLKTSPTFNIGIINSDAKIDFEGRNFFKTNDLPSNSILLIINEKTKESKIVLGDDLKDKVVTEGLLKDMYSENGKIQLKLGNVENGIEELSDSIYYHLNRSNIGENTFDYNVEIEKEEKESAKKEKEEKKKKGAMVFIVGGVFGLGVLGYIGYSINNKDSAIYKLAFGNKKEKVVSEKLIEIVNTLNDPHFRKETNLDFLKAQYKELALDDKYNSIVSKFEEDIVFAIESDFESKNYNVIERINTRIFLEKLLSKSILKLNKHKKDSLKFEIRKKNMDLPDSIFKTVKFDRLLERVDFTKEMLKTFLKNEAKEYFVDLEDRKTNIKKVLKDISLKSNVQITPEQREAYNNILENVEKEYHKEKTMTLPELRKKYEMEALDFLSEIRIASLDETIEVKEYLIKNMATTDIVYSTNKILQRNINKAKLLM